MDIWGRHHPSQNRSPIEGNNWWKEKEFPSYFMLIAAKEIRNSLGIQFSEMELIVRMRVLALRYRTFKEVVNTRGAHWERRSKYVVAADCVWKKILKANPFAAAYYYHDEPEYMNIACLFGTDDVKLEGEKEMIVISESTELISSDGTESFSLGSDVEEVNSPAIFLKSTVRQKLVFNNGDTAYRESTNDPGMYFIDVAPDGQQCTRLEKSRSLPMNPFLKNKDVGGSHKRSSSFTSSCASNSPIGSWPQLP